MYVCMIRKTVLVVEGEISFFNKKKTEKGQCVSCLSSFLERGRSGWGFICVCGCGKEFIYLPPFSNSIQNLLFAPFDLAFLLGQPCRHQ